MEAFDPCASWVRCEAYVQRCVGGRVRLVRAERLQQSTRAAPWRLDAEVDGILRSFVLQVELRRGEHEFEVLRAMEAVDIPAPRPYGWDPSGEALGVPCLLTGFVAGESLLPALQAGQLWAQELYIDTACRLQAIGREQLAPVARRLGDGETAVDVLEAAYDTWRGTQEPLAEAVYAQLKATMPAFPAPRFSNGDLYPDNVIVQARRLAGVIDWENAGFSDPIFEFLLPFFVHPELRGQGVEERYCRRMGFDLTSLHWYRGLEYLDTWHWVTKTGQPFVQWTGAALAAALERWLDGA
jgi:aminoglycoside phosphotransferase (APT) family kinase protein